MRRVSVVGNAGSGKSTVGRLLAGRLGVPFVELDAIVHQRGWQQLPTPEFRRRVAEAVAGDAWVVDGNYRAVLDLVWGRADTVIWLDLPRRTVMRQVVTRTLRRTATREVLWNGNREPVSGLFRLSPHESIIRWSWTQHARYRAEFRAAAADPAWAHLTFRRIGSRADARRLLSGP